MGFFEEVYKIVKMIPRGKVANYGQIARLAGNSKMARQVGWALHVNPYPGQIPCHRVVTKDHYISFVAYLSCDKIQLVKLYPEGNAETRFRFRGMGYLYIYCNQHGLMKIRV